MFSAERRSYIKDGQATMRMVSILQSALQSLPKTNEGLNGSDGDVFRSGLSFLTLSIKSYFKRTKFRKLYLFPSSGGNVGRYLLCYKELIAAI
jgi:hypothetical protein